MYLFLFQSMFFLTRVDFEVAGVKLGQSQVKKMKDRRLNSLNERPCVFCEQGLATAVHM